MSDEIMVNGVVTEAEIREKLSNHYGGDNSHRDLVRNHRKDDPEGFVVGSVVYSLTGSPPKGYAIWICELQMLNLYDVHGKRFQILKNVLDIRRE